MGHADTPRTPTGVALAVSDATLRKWLDDDLGAACHDVTTEALFPPEHQGSARIVAREHLVVSGLEEALRLMRMVGTEAEALVNDGEGVEPGTVLARIKGPTRGILTGERTALNLLARCSGIATLTRNVQDRIERVNPECRVSATRKTTPGFRALEKRAVVHGGGDPHRYGLFDMILIKDNHRAAGTDLAGLVHTARKAHPGLPLEVEVEDPEQAETAARAGADWILVDNQDPQALQRIQAVIHRVAPQTRIEASGGIRPENAHEWAAHAHRVSLGAITLSAPAKDLSLEWDEAG